MACLTPRQAARLLGLTTFSTLTGFPLIPLFRVRHFLWASDNLQRLAWRGSLLLLPLRVIQTPPYL